MSSYLDNTPRSLDEVLRERTMHDETVDVSSTLSDLPKNIVLKPIGDAPWAQGEKSPPCLLVVQGEWVVGSWDRNGWYDSHGMPMTSVTHYALLGRVEPDAFAAGGWSAEAPPHPLGTGYTKPGLTDLEFEPFSEADQLNMMHDFSAEPWAAECDDHGVAIRLALAIFSKTKTELVDITSELLEDEDEDGKATVLQLLERWAAARDRFSKLQILLQGAIDRQGCAILNAIVPSEGGQ